MYVNLTSLVCIELFKSVVRRRLLGFNIHTFDNGSRGLIIIPYNPSCLSLPTRRVHGSYILCNLAK